MKAYLAQLDETRKTAERELEVLRGHQEYIRELEAGRDALLDSLEARAPDALDSLTSQERHQWYKLLGLRADARVDGTVEVGWAGSGGGHTVCETATLSPSSAPPSPRITTITSPSKLRGGRYLPAGQTAASNLRVREGRRLQTGRLRRPAALVCTSRITPAPKVCRGGGDGEEAGRPETYSIDDEIRVPVVMRDENGVAHVRAVFRRMRYVGRPGRRGASIPTTR